MDFGTNYRRCICSIVKKSFLIGLERDGGFNKFESFLPSGFSFFKIKPVSGGQEITGSGYEAGKI